ETIVRFHEPTEWEKYRDEILIGVVILVLQAALITALLFERRSHRRAATALEQSQQEMNLAARAARLSMWIWDVARDKIWATKQLRQRAGLPKERPIAFNDVLGQAHPADPENLDRAVRKALANGEELDVEYRVLGPAGDVRWISARGRVDKNASERLMGVALDITARKVAELQAEKDRAALTHM